MLRIDRLSIEECTVLVDGAREKAQAMGIPMCIAVVDEAGHLIAFERMDGAKISSIDIAIDKASTAATARKGTHIYNELCQPGLPTFGIHVTNGGHFCIIGGGLPVTAHGTVVGGVGVSSGTAGEDLECAAAAVAHLESVTGIGTS